VNLTWKKCGDDGHWCALEKLNLDSIDDFGGVYIIWHEGNPGRVVYVGQAASIKDRLSVHRNERSILAYSKYGILRVTWAFVSSGQRDGVERYLANQWSPLVGEAFPDVEPIAVNSPWR